MVCSEVKPFRRIAALVFAVGFLTALLWTFVVFPRLTLVERPFDMNGYGAIGDNLYRGNGFSLGHGPTLRRAPLYPALFAAVSLAFGPQTRENHAPLLLLQCLFAGCTCLASGAIAHRLFGARAALVAGLLCAVWPQCLRYLGVVEVEATMTLLLTLLTLTVVRLYQEPTVQNGALVGLVLGLATLTKSVTLLFPLALLGLFLYRHQRNIASQRHSKRDRAKHPTPEHLNTEHRPLASLAACFGVMAALCLPWIVRNHVVTQGRFHGISSNASGEFLRGYVTARSEFALLRTKFQGHWDIQANRFEDDLLRQRGSSFWSYQAGRAVRMIPTIENELRKERLENQIAREMVFGDPLGFLRKFAIQLFTFWYLVETPAKSLLVGGLALTALALALVGWRSARAQGLDVAPVLVTVLYFPVVYAAILAFARYSMPIYPSLLALSAQGVCVIVAAVARGARPVQEEVHARR